MKEFVDYLISGLTFFENDPSAKEFDGISKNSFINFVFSTIRTSLGYKTQTDEELGEITIKEDVEILETIKVSSVSETTPKLMQELLEDAKAYQDNKSNPQIKAKFLYDINRLKASQTTLSLETTEDLKIPPITPEVAKKIASLKESAQKEPLGFKDIVIKEIQTKRPNLPQDKVVDTANVFTKALQNSPIVFAVEATLADQNFDLLEQLFPKNQEKIRAVFKRETEKTSAARDVLQEVFPDTTRNLIPTEVLSPHNFSINTSSPKEAAVLLNAETVIKTTDPINKEVTAQSFENLFVPITVPQAEVEVPITESTVPSGRFWTSPTIIGFGVKELAKEDPKLATTLTISSQKMEDLQMMGMDPRIVTLYVDELKHIEESGGKINWITEAIAAQGQLDARQIQLIKEPSSMTTLLFNQVFTHPHQSFFENLTNNLGQRIFGGTENNFIKNSLGKAAGETGRKILGKAASTALGSILPGIGNALALAGTEILSRVLPFVRRYIVLIAATLGALGGFVILGPIGAIAGGIGGAALGSGVGGGGASAAISTVSGGFVALGGAFASALIAPFVIAIIAIPAAVALILFIINSGAYVTPPGFLSGTVNIICKVSKDESQTSGSTAADAAICIVTYLNQFNLNPLLKDLVNSPAWQSLASVLPKPALDALATSAPVDGHLQCVGFVAATAGFAYGQSFGQINACDYIKNHPAGYTFVSGTSGIQSGDFFIIDSNGDCSSSSPGHIGVVISVDGTLISCADANYIADGKARTAHGCFALSQIAGYLHRR